MTIIINDPNYYERHPEGRAEAAMAVAILENAREIVTEDGHLLKQHGGVWYAYPKLDDREDTTGGEVIRCGNSPEQFPTPIIAYHACITAKERARKRFIQRPT